MARTPTKLSTAIPELARNVAVGPASSHKRPAIELANRRATPLTRWKKNGEPGAQAGGSAVGHGRPTDFRNVGLARRSESPVRQCGTEASGRRESPHLIEQSYFESRYVD
jgi:hypothetical protein